MITALTTRAPTVAIRFQPANDAPLGTPDLPTLAGSLAHRQERRWPEGMAGERVDISALAWCDESPTAARHDALLRHLIVEEAERLHIELRPGEVACQIQLFRDRFRLESAAAMRAWLAHAGITFDELVSFFRAELQMEKVEQAHWPRLERELEVHEALLLACTELPRPLPDLSAMDRGARFMDRGTSDILALMGRERSDRTLRRRLLLRVLATHEIWRRGLMVQRKEVEAMSDRFCVSFGLFEASAMWSRLPSTGLSEEGFARQMRDFAAVLKIEQLSADEIAAGVALCNAIKTVTTWSARRDLAG